MARAAKPRKLERKDPVEGSAFATMSREQLLTHPDERSAADELYRRAYNKMVKKSEA